MILSPTDRYTEHLILLDNCDADSLKRLQADAESVYGSPWSLTLRDFFALSKGDLSFIGLTAETAIQASVRQYIWMKEFKEVVEQVTAILKRLQMPSNPDQERASSKCLSTNFEESALIFARRYFELHSFSEAENTTLSDYIVARKDDYNNNIFRWAMAEIQKNKLKTRKK